MSNNRRSIRITTDAVVDVAYEKEVVLFHKIRDISQGGICIEVSSLEPVGSLVDLSISFPGVDEGLECSGEVVRASEKPVRNVGIRFLDLTAEQKELLRVFLDSQGKDRGDVR